eukprot:m.107036 g.107036  ORF g.107036 m.107036 type:complete len:55 (-) comp13908_c1_seq1:3593-3757(-)
MSAIYINQNAGPYLRAELRNIYAKQDVGLDKSCDVRKTEPQCLLVVNINACVAL